MPNEDALLEAAAISVADLHQSHILFILSQFDLVVTTFVLLGPKKTTLAKSAHATFEMSSANKLTKCAACGKCNDGQKNCEECKLDQALKDYWKDRPQPSDEALFETPPPADECLICMHSIDTWGFVEEGQSWYMPCCGKSIRETCHLDVMMEDNSSLSPCVFCRTPIPRSNKARLEMAEKRMKKYDDADAIYFIAECYQSGTFEVQKDYKKATRLYFRAHLKGCRVATEKIGSAYLQGEGVDCNFVIGMKWFTLAAVEGSLLARRALSEWEMSAGNTCRAMKHLLIAASAGHDESLQDLMQGYK
ncbi:hypothetical protein ACHAWF_012243, partial [Thalassiosira exigua]